MKKGIDKKKRISKALNTPRSSVNRWPPSDVYLTLKPPKCYQKYLIYTLEYQKGSVGYLVLIDILTYQVDFGLLCVAIA